MKLYLIMADDGSFGTELTDRPYEQVCMDYIPHGYSIAEIPLANKSFVAAEYQMRGKEDKYYFLKLT